MEYYRTSTRYFVMSVGSSVSRGLLNPFIDAAGTLDAYRATLMVP